MDMLHLLTHPWLESFLLILCLLKEIIPAKNGLAESINRNYSCKDGLADVAYDIRETDVTVQKIMQTHATDVKVGTLHRSSQNG